MLKTERVLSTGLICCVLFIGGCDRLGSGPPARYETVEIDQGPIRDIVPALGRISPADQIELGVEVGGRVLEVRVDHDDRVRRGDLLARLDPAPFETAIEQADARLRIARADFQQASAELAAAARELERAQTLADRGAGVQARVEDLSFRVDQLTAAAARAEANIDVAETALDEAELRLERSRILAPIDGFILERAVEPGQTVNASFSTPVLFVIAADLSQVVIEARVAEADIGRIEQGMRVRFRVDAYPDEAFEGVAGPLRRAPETDGRFVSYPVSIEASDAEQRLLPGMTASVEFIAAEAQYVLRAPREALQPMMTRDFIRQIDLDLLPEDLVERLDFNEPGWEGRVRGSLGGRAMGRGYRTGRNLRIVHQVVGDGFSYAEIEVGAEDDEYFEIRAVDKGELAPGDRLFVFDHGPDGP